MRHWILIILLCQSEKEWVARAMRQVQLTRNRLNFRNFVYEGKGQLPLPPADGVIIISLQPLMQMEKAPHPIPRWQ